MRGYQAAITARDQLSGDRDATLEALTAIRTEQALAVQELGRLNTEVTFWERQADTLSRQVGGVRAGALGATARLAEVQKTGTELAAHIQDQVRALRAAGHPVGTALVADGPAVIPEPLIWPTASPKGYVLPTGPSALPMRTGEPLALDRAQLPPPVKAVLTAPWSLPVKGIITTTYGDGTPYQAAHWAVDVGARLYEPVRAAADGTVEFAGLAVGDNRYASYGMIVVVRHEGGLTSLYAHLDDRAYGAALQPGDAVQKGQVLGYVGLTGNTTGPHVHFEVRLDGQPIDPLLLVNP
jgi:murein DD-endopeptidase MepM/ murein hydrolase activator NlpD